MRFGCAEHRRPNFIICFTLLQLVRTRHVDSDPVLCVASGPPVPQPLVFVGQEDKLTTGLQSNCRNGSGGPDAWSALKALKGFRSAPAATGYWQALATRACHTNSSKFKTAAGTVSWREGLRALYCRMLARAISDCLFQTRQPAYAALGAAEQEGVSSQHARALPQSWLQLPEVSGHTHVARAKAAIADRFGVVDLASLKGSARQAQGHSLIFRKAA